MSMCQTLIQCPPLYIDTVSSPALSLDHWQSVSMCPRGPHNINYCTSTHPQPWVAIVINHLIKHIAVESYTKVYLINSIFSIQYTEKFTQNLLKYSLLPPHPRMASDLQCHCLMRCSGHQQMAAPSYKYLERDGGEATVTLATPQSLRDGKSREWSLYKIYLLT